MELVLSQEGFFALRQIWWNPRQPRGKLLEEIGQYHLKLFYILTISCPISVLGEFLHPCEDDIVCKCTTDENKVPYFNAPVYLENKEQIGETENI